MVGEERCSTALETFVELPEFAGFRCRLMSPCVAVSPGFRLPGEPRRYAAIQLMPYPCFLRNAPMRSSAAFASGNSGAEPPREFRVGDICGLTRCRSSMPGAGQRQAL